ncbi:hypothetical protein [Haloarchaeobius amylolyticus]|uniref:hypothetical protein n=1 Tax=Haloarchaeobius amylolyticus TaxID=1198296 RepID=UPI00226D9F4F|nr:hypothetical protein [Haloarchaeobius amylolyticus]
MESVTDTFESTLDDARESLTAARARYQALEQTETVPHSIVDALSSFERELEELDDRLDVHGKDVEIAERVSGRIEALSGVLSALTEHQKTVIESDVRRLEKEWELVDSVEDGPSTAAIEQNYAILTKLVETGRHERIASSERIDIDELEAELMAMRHETRARHLDGEYATVLVEHTEELLPEIHEFLSALGDENDDRTSFADGLKLVKQRVEQAKSRDEGAVDDASVAFEGALMLHYTTARSYASHALASALASTIRDTDLSIQANIDECVARGDSSRLLEEIGEALTGEAAQSTAGRVKRLLAEHDGSVMRTAAATEFDIDDLLDHITTLYDDGTITDITIHFEQ